MVVEENNRRMQWLMLASCSIEKREVNMVGRRVVYTPIIERVYLWLIGGSQHRGGAQHRLLLRCLSI